MLRSLRINRAALRKALAEPYHYPRPRRIHAFASASAHAGPQCQSRTFMSSPAAFQPQTDTSSQRTKPDVYPPPDGVGAKRRKEAAGTSVKQPGNSRNTNQPQPSQGQKHSGGNKSGSPSVTNSKGPSSSSTKVTSASLTQPSKSNSVTNTPSSASSGKDLTEQQDKAAPPMTWKARLSSLWGMAKQLFKFYFQGLKQIWRNRTEVKQIKQRVREENYVLTRADKQLL